MLDHVGSSPDSNAHAGNWYVLVAGLPHLNDPLTLARGLTLVPLQAPLSVFDLAAAGAVGFREWAILEPIARLCTCEIESARDSDVTPGYDTLNRAWLLSALLVLRGFSQHVPVACSSYSWQTIAGHQKRTASAFREQLAEEGVELAVYASNRELPRFTGGILDFQRRLMMASGNRTDPVSSHDVAWIGSHFDAFNRLASESEQFRLALECAVDWRYERNARQAVARLWGGIEGLFDFSSELVFRISVLCASLLEERGPARKARFRDIKQLYGLRSKAVHGERLAEQDLAAAMNRSYKLLSDLLLLIVDGGRVLRSDDFDDALFS